MAIDCAHELKSLSACYFEVLPCFPLSHSTSVESYKLRGLNSDVTMNSEILLLKCPFFIRRI